MLQQATSTKTLPLCTAIKAVDRTLQDLTKQISRLIGQPFGGKVIVVGGNFRQVLPVVQHGSAELNSAPACAAPGSGSTCGCTASPPTCECGASPARPQRSSAAFGVAAGPRQRHARAGARARHPRPRQHGHVLRCPFSTRRPL